MTFGAVWDKVIGRRLQHYKDQLATSVEPVIADLEKKVSEEIDVILPFVGDTLRMYCHDRICEFDGRYETLLTRLAESQKAQMKAVEQRVNELKRVLAELEIRMVGVEHCLGDLRYMASVDHQAELQARV